MRKIFICAGLKYLEETKLLSERLERVGFKVSYAAKDTLKGLSSQQIYRRNLQLIEESDLLVAYFTRDGHYGIDFAIEVGKASGTGKPVIGAVDLDDDAILGFKGHLDSDIMFKHSFTVFFWSISDLLEHLRCQDV